MAKEDMSKLTKAYIIDSALKQFYGEKQSSKSRIELIKQILTTDKGKMWVAETLFGKPTQTTETLLLTKEIKNDENVPIIRWIDEIQEIQEIDDEE